jgi:hypothetical protein
MPTDSPLLEKASSVDRSTLQELLDAIEQSETTTTDARDAAESYESSAADSESSAADSETSAAQSASDAQDYARTARQEASDAANASVRAQRAEEAAEEVAALAPLSRTLVVDGRFDGNVGNVAFGTVEGAVLYARGVVDYGDGKVLIRCYHDAGGEPISVDLRDHDIAPDPLDEDIRIVSPIFSRQKQELMLYGEADHANLAGTIRHDDIAISINTSS